MNPREINRNVPTAPPATKDNKIGWKLMLLLPFIGLCFPAIYARATPALFGFPFFYWYQFLWVILTSALLGFIYLKLKDADE
jgi:hypothetical protein